MKTKATGLRVIALAFAIGAIGAIAQQNQVQAPMAAGMKMDDMADHKQMMAMHEQMMAEMQAMDAKMDQKVAAMNASKGNAKTNAIADVINEMVSQQKQMAAKMAGMHGQMMEHMEHPDGAMKGMEKK